MTGRARISAALVATFAVALLALALTGCETVIEETNGPVGDAKVRTGIAAPPALWRKSSTHRTVEAAPGSPATSEGTCESGVCSPK